jgi:hypothetical protein
LKKPALLARPIWSSSSPGFLRRWLAEAMVSPTHCVA